MSSQSKKPYEDPSKNQRSLSVWLAGRLQQEAYQSIAERIAWDVSEPNGRSPTLVIYEPATGITIGRLGSHTDIDIPSDELVRKGIAVRFVGRGGGAVLHGPGQVGIALFCSPEQTWSFIV